MRTPDHRRARLAGRSILWFAAGVLVLLIATAIRGGLPWHIRGARVADGLRTFLAHRSSVVLQPAHAGEPGLRLVQTIPTRHGNAAGLAWSDDGRVLFLANEEGWMSAVKIDVGDPSRPRIAATQAADFLWAVAQQHGLLVFQPSLGDETLRLDPRSLGVVWRRKTAHTHAIATDGSRVYLAEEGRPGTLIVLNANGQEVTRLQEPGGWASVYGTTYAADRGLLCVAATGDEAKGIPGGIYLYDVRGGRPTRLGRIPRSASEIAVRAGRLWVAAGSVLETWRIADPAHPTLMGTWQQPAQPGPGGTPVRPDLGSLAVDPSGTRLYAAYTYATADEGHPVSDWWAGVMIFDVARDVPALLSQQDWRADASYHPAPTRLALSPDGRTLGVSYWRYGVRLFSVPGDRTMPLGVVGTVGEAHDVYVDAQGILYVFANETMQIIDLRSGEHLRDVPLDGRGDGGWRPFRDGNILVPGQEAVVLRLAGGEVRLVQALPGFGNYTWSLAFDGAGYLYQADEGGRVHVDEVSALPDGTYRVVEVGSVQVPAVAGDGSNPLLAMALGGRTLWVLGPNTGLVGVDTSVPSSPRVVAHEAFTFQTNGNHAGLVVARGRVYAGAGSAGVVIYDPATRRRTGAIGGLSVDFLDALGSDFLVVANYWYPSLPEGAYVYDLRRNPDAPPFVDRFPRPEGSANFRARVLGHRIYRVALSGIDILEGP